MQIPPELLKCVCFVERLAGSERKFSGTAFLVAKPLEGVLPSVQVEPVAVYAVTAAHNLRDEFDDPWDGVRLCLNTRDGGIDFIDAPPDDWLPHPTSDTAVLSLGYDLGAFDCRHYPIDSYVDVDFFKMFKLSPGEEVLITGLLWAHPGAPQITPIVRIGHVASWPLDQVKLDTGTEGAVLVEVLSFGGLSGSPAFIHLGDFRRDDYGRGDLMTLEGERGVTGSNFLLGHVHGRFETQEPRRYTTEPLNVGITAVIPAARAQELIDHVEYFVKEREAMAKKLNDEAPTTKRLSVRESRDDDSEYERFETLARHVIATPKPEPEKKETS